MKVKLIFPRLDENVDTFHDNTVLSNLVRRSLAAGSTNHVPPLSLLMLGAVTPSDVNVRIVDERLEEDDYSESVDLVGISIMTRTATRAYEIAERYRKRGVTVVAGGIHPSVVPEESTKHADVIVIGEGEEVWPQILSDFKERRLRRIYSAKAHRDIDDSPLPKRELLAHPERYFTLRVIAASRGCPNSCTFCTVGSAGTKRYRARAIESVIEELQDVPGKFVLFADDNMGWDLEYSKRLLKALIPLRVIWAGGVSASAFEDEEFTDLVAESGCMAVEIGLESIRENTIKEMRKTHTNHPDRYRSIIAGIHDRKVMVKGNFVLGFDEDDNRVFDEVVRFVDETCIEMPSINTLTPFPGTHVFKKLDREGRLLHRDWENYDTVGGSVVYKPRQMTHQDLKEGYFSAKRSVFSTRSTIKRLLGAGTFLRGVVPYVGTLAAIHWNLQNRHGTVLEMARSRCHLAS